MFYRIYRIYSVFCPKYKAYNQWYLWQFEIHIGDRAENALSLISAYALYVFSPTSLNWPIKSVIYPIDNA